MERSSLSILINIWLIKSVLYLDAAKGEPNVPSGPPFGGDDALAEGRSTADGGLHRPGDGSRKGGVNPLLIGLMMLDLE